MSGFMRRQCLPANYWSNSRFGFYVFDLITQNEDCVAHVARTELDCFVAVLDRYKKLMNVKSPVLVVVLDADDFSFGAFCTADRLQPSGEFVGTGLSGPFRAFRMRALVFASALVLALISAHRLTLAYSYNANLGIAPWYAYFATASTHNGFECPAPPPQAKVSCSHAARILKCSRGRMKTTASRSQKSPASPLAVVR